MQLIKMLIKMYGNILINNCDKTVIPCTLLGDDNYMDKIKHIINNTHWCTCGM